LDSCVEGWVADLSRAAPLSVRAIKEAVLRFLDMPIEQAFVTRFEWEQRRMDSRDAVECPRAFVADRKPAWQCR
jgi:enoyl-CoA hydratase/carnithine racemase